MNFSVFAAFFVYFFVLLIIGLVAHKKQSSDADFIVGNRSLNFWLIALSAHASDMSAWLFMAFPAAIFLNGIPQFWAAFGLLIGMYLNWQLVARKLRIMTEQYESYTLSTFFERRFNDRSGWIRILTATMATIFLACYLSGGLMAMGRLFEAIFNVNYYLGLTVATVVAMTYTFFGGFITVAWTDLFQALFLLVMIIIVPIIAYLNIDGGFSAIESIANSKQIALSLFSDSSISFLAIVFLIFGWGLGYFGQPHIITKFMGIRDANEMYKSKYLGMSWMFVALLAAASVGFIGIGFFPGGLDNPELVFVNMVKSLFPAFFAGLVLCGFIAANMSTMDSQILVCASILSEDFYKYIAGKQHASPKDLLRASRISVIIVSLVSLIIAFNRSTTILNAVLYAWTGLGCAFGPLVLMSLYYKNANKYGAVAGILVGGILAGGWHFINPFITSYEVPAMIPGFFLSLASIYIVSELTSKRQESLQSEQ